MHEATKVFCKPMVNRVASNENDNAEEIHADTGEHLPNN
jgi:hypothetical protein